MAGGKAQCTATSLQREHDILPPLYVQVTDACTCTEAGAPLQQVYWCILLGFHGYKGEQTLPLQ